MRNALLLLSLLFGQIYCVSAQIFTDILFWSAKESGADNWAQRFSPQTIDILDVAFGWDAGFRCGFDYGISRDSWDAKLAYTWFRTQGSDQADVANGSITSSFLGNFYINNADGKHVRNAPQYQSANIRWTILFSMFDGELGRKCRVGKALLLRPFLSLKGGWIRQAIRSAWQTPRNIPAANAFTAGTENLNNNFWGIGPGMGLDTQWTLGQSASLFADFSGALLWGHWTFKDVYQNDHPRQVSVIVPPIDGAASMLRAFMGFMWEFPTKRCDISLRIGYESQFWLDQLQFYSYNTGRLANLLTLQGGTAELRMGF